MKRKILKWIMYAAGICTFLFFGNAQPSVRINYIDANGYPNIKAYYTYEDAAGNQVRPPNYDWKPQDIIINESGKIRTHNTGSPSCPAQTQKAFSAILIFDVSLSMSYNMDGTNDNPPPGEGKWEVAFRAMDHFISALDPALTECAIIEFGTVARIRQWYTNDKDSLLQIVTTKPNFSVRTNYNTAFLRNKPDANTVDSTQSALYIAKYAKYKPVIIFLTDGKHYPPTSIDPGPFEVGAAYTKARQNGVYVFVVKIGTETLDGTSSANLSTMAGVEGSISDNLAMNVTDPNSLIGFYDKVLQICGQVGYPAPCNVEWTSDCLPNGPRTVDLTFPNHGNLTASRTFTVAGNLKPFLDISPKRIDFKNTNPPAYSDVQVKITAKNNYVDFYDPGFVSTDPRYSIINWGVKGKPPFRLDNNTSTTITVRYSPADSLCSSGVIDFVNSIASSACIGNIPVSGQFDQFVRDVNMGDATVNTDKDVLVTSVFCNRSCKPVTVTAFDIKTGDASMFSHFGLLTLPKTLNPGECISDTFRFHPTNQGPKSAKINVVLDTGAANITLISNITGNAIGQPGITSENPVFYQNADCANIIRDTIINIRNTGPIPLVITNWSFTGTNPTEFQLIGTMPASIAGSSSEPVTVRFAPKFAGPKQCNLHIESNAASNPQYDIQLNGFADSVNYEPEKTIDLGIVCLGSTKDTVISLANVGSKTLRITPFSVPSEFSLSTYWDVTDSTTTKADVSFIPTKDGPISADIIFTESLCNIQKTVHFIGTVHDPKVTNTNIIVTSTVSTPKDTTITITNASTSVGLKVDNIVFDDPQFVLLSTNPALSYTILPGGSMTATFRYTPSSDTVVNTNLRMKGMPCRDVLIPLIGNPSQATVDIAIDKHTGLVGQVVQIPVYLRKANKFAESGTTTIDFDVSFDASLLQQAPPPSPQRPESTTAGIRTLLLKGFPVTSTNNDQTVVTLNLLVTDGNVTSTPLTITNSKSDKNNVVFDSIDGLFSLIEASATLQTKNYEKYPGEEFDLEIWQSNPINISAFHDSIETEVRCNASVLEGVGLPYKTEKGDRIVTLKGIPISTNSGNTMLKSFKFRPMLGNSDTTYIILQNSRSTKGKIKFDTVVSKLTLKGVCVDPNGTKRLFDATPPAVLQAINPNPTNGITEVKFFLSEPGLTKIWLSNVLGDKMLEIANDYMKSGNGTLSFDANNLPDGVYFVIMQTPTQLFKKRFNIIK
ncbi:MAG: choice-of-anchor D domain-containing protein [Bacteroidetes bacterium]|nr:MAG: choice-of-anchor D domain-containing protein [Bacteroidota bacterium]